MKNKALAHKSANFLNNKNGGNLVRSFASSNVQKQLTALLDFKKEIETIISFYNGDLLEEKKFTIGDVEILINNMSLNVVLYKNQNQTLVSVADGKNLYEACIDYLTQNKEVFADYFIDDENFLEFYLVDEENTPNISAAWNWILKQNDQYLLQKILCCDIVYWVNWSNVGF